MVREVGTDGTDEPEPAARPRERRVRRVLRRSERDRAEEAVVRRRVRRVRTVIRRADRHPRLLALTAWLRRAMPGDPAFGDPLSVSGSGAGSVVGRRLATVAAHQPSVLREVGLGALQVWQANAGTFPHDVGDRELAVLFTDLAGFSDWTLDVGDELAVRMLREVGTAVEPLISHRGHIVKWLGDGIMAVFPDADSAVEAAIAARDAARAVDVSGHCLPLRAGVHLGRPRKLGDDFFGRDVNIAARVAAPAGPGEVLISGGVRQNLHAQRVRLRRRARFTAKGVPEDVRVWSVTGS